MRPVVVVLAILALGLAGLLLAQQVLRAQGGPLPLVSVFEVHLLAVAVVLAVLALLGALGGGRGRAWLRLALVAVIVLGVVRLGDELWSPGPSSAAAGTADELTILSWNLEQDSKAGSTLVEGLAEIDADVIALQELTPQFAEAIDADPDLGARYPYRILDPRPGSEGLGVLATRPLLVRGRDPRVQALHAGLLLDDGRTAELLVVHPRRPQYGTTFSIPRSLNTRTRDLDLARIRQLVDGLEDPASAIVVGDLNAAPTEPGRGVLDGGLTDAHRAAGSGPGFTWRPAPLQALDLGLLRIDAVLSGAWLQPTDSHVDCTIAGDHCRLVVTLRIVPPAS
jgi:endonuclease/exonuclease/phosphatase (EEP) superfamily protein YafD